jgi:hypothetical protein
MNHANAARRLPLIALLGVGLTISATQVASAQVTPPASLPAQPILQNTLAFKAQPDECFVAIGSTGNVFPHKPPCPKGSTPKANQSYTWGMTETGSNLWFGTAVSGDCLTRAGRAAVNHQPSPVQTPSYVCEFAARTASPVTPGYGDWRPPKIYRYDAKLKKITEYSSAAGPNLNKTVGIRSAGSTSSIVILGGLSINRGASGFGAEGIYLFAFTPTGTFLGSMELTQYSDIRHWVVLGGQLYTGVQAQDGAGRVLHWIGSPSNPFAFEEVATIETDVANITVLGDQIYATTWGGGNSPHFPSNIFASGLWVSPHSPVNTDPSDCGWDPNVGPASLGTGPHPERCWHKIWDITLYEPDFVTGVTLLGGAVEAYNNQIYWGTMQIPHIGPTAHSQAYGYSQGSLTAAQQQTLFVNTTRATPVFRYNPNAGPDCFTTPNACQMLYGATSLPVEVANPSSGHADGTTFTNTPNGQTALYGPAGFGQPVSTYMWSSAVYQNRLFFGVLDGSFSDAQSANTTAGMSAAQNNQVTGANANKYGYGADLWRFDTPTGPAKAESLTGLGNYLSYGIRNMVADKCNLYVGMANAMQLRTSGTPQGGLEFRVLTSSGEAGCTP